MLRPGEWALWLSRWNWQTDKNLLKSIPLKLNSSEKGPGKWLLHQTKVLVRTPEESRTHEWNRKMEKSVPSHWKEQNQGNGWSPQLDGISAQKYDRSGNKRSYYPLPKWEIPTLKLNQKRTGNAGQQKPINLRHAAKDPKILDSLNGAQKLREHDRGIWE